MSNYLKILNNHKYSKTLKSISALHIVKYHSGLLVDLKSSFLVSNFIKVLIIDSLKTFFQIFINSFKTKESLPRKQILIISHMINKEYLNSKNDFYFGELENILKKQNKNFIKLMINHTNESSSYLNSKKKNKNAYILAKYLNFKFETLIILKKITTIFEILSLFLFRKINLQDFFKLTFSLFDSSTTFTMRMYYQIQEHIKQIRPEYCFITYEGFSWERMCINSVKNFDKKIKCIGYQHTPVTENHYSIFQYLNGNFNPDKIWCSQYPSFKKIKKKIKNKNKVQIEFFGNLKTMKLQLDRVKNKNLFLVIPEGIYSECKKLFEISLKISKKFSNFIFIWRVHPVIDFKRVLNMMKLREKNIPKNIKLSKNEFDKDAAKSSYAIYKGSAAALKAVLLGNYPMYFKSTNEKNFDPLKNLFNQKNYFRDEKEFIKLFKLINKNGQKRKIKDKIIKIQKDMFKRPNIDKIKFLLKK